MLTSWGINGPCEPEVDLLKSFKQCVTAVWEA